jgi:hypothetical protein
MTEKKTGKCPLCGKEADAKFRPFCCARCAQIDLGRWLGEKYVIPTEEGPTEVEAREEKDD